MYRLCVNTKLFYIKDLSIHKLRYSKGSWNLSAGGYQGTITPTLCIYKCMCIDVYVCMYTHTYTFSHWIWENKIIRIQQASKNNLRPVFFSAGVSFQN